MRHRAAPEHVDHGMYVDWEPVQSWLEKAVKEGWLAEIGVTAATLAILGWSVLAVHKAMQSYQVVGYGLF